MSRQNYFNTLTMAQKLDQLGRCRFMDRGEFNGVEKWKTSVRKAAKAARGWVIVGYDLNDGSVFNYLQDTQNLWAVHSMVPVLAHDVY